MKNGNWPWREWANISPMDDITFIPLAPTEKELLQYFLEDEKRSLTGWIFSAILLAAIAPFFPSRHRKWEFPSSVEMYLQRAIIFALILLGGILLYYFSKTKNLRRDIAAGKKAVAQVAVRRKMRSSFEHTFTILLDCDLKGFQQFNVGQMDYDAIREGQHVTLEYAPHSKHLFSINWHLAQHES